MAENLQHNRAHIKLTPTWKSAGLGGKSMVAPEVPLALASAVRVATRRYQARWGRWATRLMPVTAANSGAAKAVSRWQVTRRREGRPGDSGSVSWYFPENPVSSDTRGDSIDDTVQPGEQHGM